MHRNATHQESELTDTRDALPTPPHRNITYQRVRGAFIQDRTHSTICMH